MHGSKLGGSIQSFITFAYIVCVQLKSFRIAVARFVNTHLTETVYCSSSCW